MLYNATIWNSLMLQKKKKKKERKKKRKKERKEKKRGDLEDVGPGSTPGRYADLSFRALDAG